MLGSGVLGVLGVGVDTGGCGCDCDDACCGGAGVLGLGAIAGFVILGVAGAPCCDAAIFVVFACD